MKRVTCNMPEELLMEIMSWLPPESLFRFKCVSNSWYVLINHLIKDPAFVAKHLHHSMSSTYILYSFGKNKIPRLKLLNLLSDVNVDDWIDFFTDDLTSRLIPRKFYAKEWIERFHCNGIICLSNPCSMAVALYNPSINEYRLLPHSNLSGVFNFESDGVGFGYDSRANDYKVVKFGCDCSKKFLAEVYSLAADSWREICFNVEVDNGIYYHSTAYVKGVFYWFIPKPKRMILSFDMCDEVFDIISMPGDDRSPSSWSWTSITVWNESLAVIYNAYGEDEDEDTIAFEIWAMENCSVKGSYSWKKVFIVEPLLEVSEPQAFRNNDELILGDSECELLSYNIHSQKFRELNIKTTVMYWSFSYVKSLVSVQGRD